MERAQAKRIVEAVLFVFSQPLGIKRLGEVLPDLDAAAVRQIIQSLNEEYTASARAFQIQEVAGGYQIVTDSQLAPWIQRALQGPKPDAVSKGALETLAIIAYRQPMTKAEIEAIRGVDVTASLDSLIERRFARVAGRKESPGRPYLYGTTTEFLRHFGLKSLEALPTVNFPTLKEPTTASAPSEVSAEAAAQAADVPVVSPQTQPQTDPQPSRADQEPEPSHTAEVAPVAATADEG